MNRLFDSIALARPCDSNDYITLDIRGIRNNTVHIVLDSHFTIVSDNSGTGKTYIHDVIENRGRNRINIECNLPVVTIRKVSEFGDLVEKSLVIIDEDAECIVNGIDKLQEKVLNTNHVFLIFSRDKAFAGIPYSINDIKVVKSYKGTITLENKYPNYYENYS